MNLKIVSKTTKWCRDFTVIIPVFFQNALILPIFDRDFLTAVVMRCAVSYRRRRWPAFIRSCTPFSSTTIRRRSRTTRTLSAAAVSPRSVRSCRVSSHSYRPLSNSKSTSSDIQNAGHRATASTLTYIGIFKHTLHRVSPKCHYSCLAVTSAYITVKYR